MQKQQVIIRDLGTMDYQQAWDYQERLLRSNVLIKSAARSSELALNYNGDVENNFQTPDRSTGNFQHPHPLPEETAHYLLFVEHPPVYTLGKSGRMEHLLLTEEQRTATGIQFFKINRGGDITFHGPGQIVGYPILDLEKFYKDIGKYLRDIEEVIIRTLADYGLKGERSKGETGVWLDPGRKGRERKICAIGVRCSRWITMHGFAFNVNTSLNYFDYIIPCGIRNKQVTSLQKELGREMSVDDVKWHVQKNFMEIFQVELINDHP